MQTQVTRCGREIAFFLRKADGIPFKFRSKNTTISFQDFGSF
jgi:hypothetical protein